MDCAICGDAIKVMIGGWADGNNAQPVNDGRCCDPCDMTVVIPARLVGAGYSKANAERIGYILNTRLTP